MRNLILFLRKFFPELALLLAIFISLNLLNSSSGKHHNVLFSALGSTSASIFSVKSSVSGYFSLSEKNQRLQEENQRLKNSLNKSLAYSPGISYTDSVQMFRFQACDIINSTIHKENNYFTLNQGKANGVKSGVAVVSNKGIVGVVSHAGEHYSIVLPILNQRFTASAEHQKTGSFGFLSWPGVDPRYLILGDVANHVNISVGDTIISRGSNIYPRGIELGAVSKVEKQAGKAYLDIEVKVFEDFSSLRHVFWVDKMLRQEQDSLENIQEAL